MPESTALGGVPGFSRQPAPTTVRTIYGLLYLTVVVATGATVAAIVAYQGASDAFVAQYANNPEAFVSGLLQAVALIAVTLITVVWLQLKATGAWQFATVSTAIVAGVSLVVALTQAGDVLSSTLPGLLVHPTLVGSLAAIVMAVAFGLLLCKRTRSWYPQNDL